MKKILISLLFLPLFAFGQDSATYTLRLDTFGLDSFFLVEKRASPQQGLPRAIETEYPIYMTDTAQLSAYIVSMRAEYDAITAQATELAKRKSAWDYRYQRVICLRDSVFYGASCTGVGSRMVKAPPPESGQVITHDTMTTTTGSIIYRADKSNSGCWLLYDKGGYEWVETPMQGKGDCTVLYRNGTTAKFVWPKAKQPKKSPPKKKKQ